MACATTVAIAAPATPSGITIINKRSRKILRTAAITRKITGVLLAITGLTALIVSGSFDRYFVIFHHLFFDNDLWILNPTEDNLINLLPEGFFSDTAFRIGEIFLLMELAMCAAFMGIRRKRVTYK